ncbi:restriction endonuclease subunit S, partial [Gallibacterium melopsittaci]
MMKNNKIPKLRFPEFTDAWEQCKLGEVNDVRDGTHSSPKYLNEGYPLVTSKNLTEHGLNLDDISFISAEDFEEINKRSKVEIGDIVFGMIGTIGNPILLERDGFAIKNVALLKRDGKVENIFLVQLLKSPIFEKYICKENAGGTQKFLGLSQIRDFTFLAPPLPEQQKIGTFFRQLDALITLHKRKVEHSVRLKKALLQKMFPKEGEDFPELRFPEFTDAWEQCKLGEVGDTYTGLSGKKKEDFGHGDARFITYMNVFSNAIADASGVDCVEIDNKQNQVKYGDVLFTTSSETPDEVGMSSIWLETKENIYLNSFCFGYRPSKEFDPHYLAFLLRSPSVRANIKLLAQGISRYNISKTKLMEQEISVPTLPEQQKIGE